MGKYHMLSHGFEKDRTYTDSRTLFEDRHILNEFYFYKKNSTGTVDKLEWYLYYIR